MRNIYLLCNAHIDPVWQWGEKEGIGAALSTFRTASRFCRENDDFVFNHNEALLYRWVEQYEPELFEEIRRLVRLGCWRIIGGFELQPDCVLPAGEAYIRQILKGQSYFRTRFGKRPRSAVLFDSFGHSRGLVQILRDAGYHSYLFMRPEKDKLDLPDTFLWEGLDGSRIIAHRLTTSYNTPFGEAAEKLHAWLDTNGQEQRIGLFAWGVGDHGGGPSQKDIEDLRVLGNDLESEGIRLIQGGPEDFFTAVAPTAETLPVVSKSLYPSMVGGYTSMYEIKQAYRQAENVLLKAEKMASYASLCGLLDYPRSTLENAWEALLFLQFHDVLPGTVTEEVMHEMLQKAGYISELADRVINAAFFAFAAREAQAKNGSIPLLIYNPHPYRLHWVAECEFMLPDQSWDESVCTVAKVYHGSDPLPTQMIRENSNIPLDWRKRVAFHAVLEPCSMNRFDCRLQKIPVTHMGAEVPHVLQSGSMRCMFDAYTGLPEIWIRGWLPFSSPFGRIRVMEDNEDPWHMASPFIDHPVGEMVLDPGAGLRLVEDGPVRAVVEGRYIYKSSYAVVQYLFEKTVQEFRIRIELVNQEPDVLFKLEFPEKDREAQLLTETMFGMEPASCGGSEIVSHRLDYLRVGGRCIGIVNEGNYGGSFTGDLLYKNLLRSPAFCAHPIKERAVLPSNRHTSRMGVGRYCFSFVLLFGEDNAQTLAKFTLRAQLQGEQPVAVSFFPGGDGKGMSQPPACRLDGPVVLSACKAAEDGKGWIFRLYEPAGSKVMFRLTVGGAFFEGCLDAHEIRTYRLYEGKFSACSCLEESSEGTSEKI